MEISQLPKKKPSDTHVNMTLKKKWFDMILSGEKKEEYREIKEYWETRIFQNETSEDYPDDLSLFCGGIYTGLGFIVFRNGYRPDSPMFITECKGVTIGKMKKEWTESDWDDNVFILKLGEIVYRKNC